jgi:hypothetical protein
MNQKQLRQDLEMCIRAEFEAVGVVREDAADDPDAWTEAELNKEIKSQTKMIFPFLVELRKELKEKGPLTQEQYATASTLAIEDSYKKTIEGLQKFNHTSSSPLLKAFNENLIEFSQAMLEQVDLYDDPSATEEQKTAAVKRTESLLDEIGKLSGEMQTPSRHRNKSSED